MSRVEVGYNLNLNLSKLLLLTNITATVGSRLARPAPTKPPIAPLSGDETMRRFDLHPLKEGYYRGYDPSIDAGVSNVFATAAFRFGHSLLPGVMKMTSGDEGSEEYVRLHRMLLDPFRLYVPGELERALGGAARTSVLASDPYFTSEVGFVGEV